MKCMNCWFGSQRKCRHEMAYSKMLVEAGSASLSQNGEILELGALSEWKEDAQNVGESDSEYSDEGTDDGVDAESESCNPDIVTGNGPRNGRCLNQPEIFFTSRKPRSLYTCAGEQKLCEKLTDLVEEWDRGKGGLSYVDRKGWQCQGTVRDSNNTTCKCECRNETALRILPSNVSLFTLNQGVFSIVLHDRICVFTRTGIMVTLMVYSRRRKAERLPLNYCIFGCIKVLHAGYRSDLFLS